MEGSSKGRLYANCYWSRSSAFLQDTVSLWVVRLGLSMLDVIQGQIELVIMRFRLATILGAAVGQDADHAHALLGEER